MKTKTLAIIAVVLITVIFTACHPDNPPTPTPTIAPTLTILGQSHLTTTGVEIDFEIQSNGNQRLAI